MNRRGNIKLSEVTVSFLKLLIPETEEERRKRLEEIAKNES